MANLLYARYSSTAQNDSTSIEVQVEQCERAAGGPCRGYIDRARTGRAMAGRESLIRLLDEARPGDVVWVYKWDRLGRSAADSFVLVRDLEEAGVEVRSVCDGNDALGRGVQLVVAEHYSRALAQRTRDGLIRRFQQGQHAGGVPPYGYRVMNGLDGTRRVEIHSAEAQVVRDIFDLYLNRALGTKAIANALAGRGLVTRAGTRWVHTTVRCVLTCEMLTGRMSFNRRAMRLNRQTGRRVPVWKQEAEVVTRQDESLRIIPDATWEACRNRMASRAHHSERSTVTIHPFTGLVTCGACGSMCCVRWSTNSKGRYPYLACSRRQRIGRDACPNAATIREDKLLDRVNETLAEVFEETDTLVELAVHEAERILGVHRREGQEMKSKVGELDRKIAAMTDALADGDPTSRKAVMRQIGALEKQRDDIYARVQQLADAANNNTEKLAKAVRQAMAEARESVVNVTAPAEIREYVREFVGEMVLTEAGQVEEKPDARDHAPGVIAGACYVTQRTLRAMVWERMKAA